MRRRLLLLATWFKIQGPALCGIAIILSLCIPLFFITLADHVSGPDALISKSNRLTYTGTPYNYHSQLLQPTTQASVVRAIRVTSLEVVDD